MHNVRIKTPVKLRTKKLNNGILSLYLDIYLHGKRKREFLKLYISSSKSKEAKEENKRILKIAESYRLKRLLSIQEKTYSIEKESDTSKISFYQYMHDTIEKMKSFRSTNYIKRYNSVKAWVYRYDYLTALKDIDKNWIKGFIKYITVTPNKYGRLLSNNSIHGYLIYITSILSHAVKEGLITNNPISMMDIMDKPKKEEKRREYLTIEEVKKLMSIKVVKHKDVYKAFMFSCFCGLRYSDIEQLKWSNIRKENGKFILTKKLQKTQNILYLPLNNIALEYIKGEGRKDDFVFHLPKSRETIEKEIKRWCKNVGINKHITFHCARHTFAIMILAKGGDVYTLSKLLGHKKVTTTQIYAEVINESKKKTIELLDTIK